MCACLQSIADTGKLVIACFQQPSPRELTTFNNIQLLKSGGETVYFGPAGISAEFLIVIFCLFLIVAAFTLFGAILIMIRQIVRIAKCCHM